MLFLLVELVGLPFRAAGCSYLLSYFVQSYVLCTPFWTVVLIRSAGYDIAYALWLVDESFALGYCALMLGLLVYRYPYMLSSTIHTSKLMLLLISLFDGSVHLGCYCHL